MVEIAGQPQIEQDDILTRCKEAEEAGMAITKSWTGMWNESMRYFLSDQLRGKKHFKNWEWVVLNYIWPSIMLEIAKLSRNFAFVVSPPEASDSEFSDAFQGLLQWQWQKGLKRGGMRTEQLKAILCGKLYGYRISKIYWDGKVKWDPEQRRWVGDVRHRLWHPSMFWASDREYIEDGDCGTVRYLELEYAKSLWPEFSDELSESAKSYPEMLEQIGDATIHGQTSHGGTYPSAGTGDPDPGTSDSLRNTLLSLVVQTRRTNYTQMDTKRYCRISEEYLKDYTEIDKSEELPADPDALRQQGAIVQDQLGNYVTPEGNEITSDMWPSDKVEWKEPVYPNGRYIIRCEDIILNPDPESQVYPHSRWPFVVTPHYLLPFMWQGSDAVSLYRDTQDKINITISHMVNNTREFGDPKIAVETDALAVDPKNTKRRFEIAKGAGAIIRLVRGGMNRWKVVPPVALSSSHLMLYQLFAQEYKNIQGLQDIAQGRKTGADTTATEAQYLAITSNERIKLQNIFEEEWAKGVITLAAEMDQYYYDVGRIVRIIGDDKVLGATQISEGMKAIEFDIDIEPTEGLIYDEEKKIQKYRIAYELLNAPPNPLLPDFLRVLGISSWQKILQRLPAWQEYMQFEQLIKAVNEGEVAPEDALKMLIEGAKQKLVPQPTEGQ